MKGASQRPMVAAGRLPGDVSDDGRRLAAAVALWPASGTVGRIAVTGESMAPLLRDGDRVRVRAEARPRFGDVVVVRAGSGMVVHRLVGLRDGRLVLHGDNVPASDPPLMASSVIGVVTAVESRRGPWRRLDTAGERVLAHATAVLARTAVRAGVRRPRPGWLPGVVRRLADRTLSRMAPEDALVLLLARQNVDEDAAARARDLIDIGVDWEAAVEAAYRGQLGPLLYAGVRQLGGDASVPESARMRMRALYAGSWTRSLHQKELLDRLLKILDDAGIPVLAHKGAALAATVYSDPALRIGGDLDLSVRDADHARAERLTHAVRAPLFAANPDRRSPAGFHVELDGTAHHDLEASRHGGGHWQTEPLDWTAIWERATPVVVGERTMLVPCPTDLVLTLIANAVRRGFTPPRLVADLAEAIAHLGSDVDWPALHASLVRTRLDRRSWIALELAAAWFGAEVPAPLLEPPRSLRLLGHERLILAAKRRRPTWRVPSRLLWAGSYPVAARIALRLGAVALGEAIRVRMGRVRPGA